MAGKKKCDASVFLTATFLSLLLAAYLRFRAGQALAEKERDKQNHHRQANC